MSVKEVTILRRAGKLEEAYDMARRDLNEEPNEWTRMSLFWVLRDIAMKIYVPTQNIEKARTCLNQMKNLLPNMLDDNGAGEIAYHNLHKLILPHANEVKSALELSKTDSNAAYKNITTLFGTDARQLESEFHEDFGWIIYRYMKANTNQLTSVQIRCLLRDYMQLKNERPSLLHSVILNYALTFSNGHSDFNFYKFFILWGAKNLRYEDYQEGMIDDHRVPSLTSRICKVILNSNEDFDVSDFVLRFEQQNVVVEDLRQSYFWKLMNLHKENKLDDLFHSFNYYADNYSCLGPSHWHSEILKIANRFMTNENANKFIPFMIKWNAQGNLRNDDWTKETNEEGTDFPSLAVKSAKKCFEIIKTMPKEMVSDATLIWLKELFKQVKQNNPDDDWSIRNYATICIWHGEIEEAVNLYKTLIIHMGDKYYLWSELANMLLDNENLSIGLLLKAKKLERNEDFLGDIHLNLASLWLKKGYVAIANEELKAYANHRKDKGWNVSEYFNELQAKVTINETKTHYVDFNSYINDAEDYVYGEFEWTDFVITNKWTSEDVERCCLYDGKETHLNIKTKKFPLLKNAKIGDVIQFRYNVIEEKQPNTSYSSWINHTIKVKRTIPLVARKTEKEAWSILPIKYGVIDYVNESKRILHIITQSSEQVFSQYNEKSLPVNSFVKFREYEDKRKDEIHTCVANVESCSPEEALQYMPKRVVVVDDVNYKKKLFHVVLGPGKISDVVRFDQTEIRPNIGDFLRIIYCVKKNKEGKKKIKFLEIQTSETGCKDVKGTVTGRLEIKYRDEYSHSNDKPDFAFIKDFYVHRKLLEKYNITNDCNVVAKVVLGGDNKWKVYDLEINQ